VNKSAGRTAYFQRTGGSGHVTHECTRSSKVEIPENLVQSWPYPKRKRALRQKLYWTISPILHCRREGIHELAEHHVACGNEVVVQCVGIQIPNASAFKFQMNFSRSKSKCQRGGVCLRAEMRKCLSASHCPGQNETPSTMSDMCCRIAVMLARSPRLRSASNPSAAAEVRCSRRRIIKSRSQPISGLGALDLLK
jgi:hypothetical protein